MLRPQSLLTSSECIHEHNNRANSTEVRQKFGEASSDTVRQWLSEKGAAHAAAAYRCKFKAKKRLYKEQELVVSRDSSIEEQL